MAFLYDGVLKKNNFTVERDEDSGVEVVIWTEDKDDISLDAEELRILADALGYDLKPRKRGKK